MYLLKDPPIRRDSVEKERERSEVRLQRSQSENDLFKAGTFWKEWLPELLPRKRPGSLPSLHSKSTDSCEYEDNNDTRASQSMSISFFSEHSYSIDDETTEGSGAHTFLSEIFSDYSDSIDVHNLDSFGVYCPDEGTDAEDLLFHDEGPLFVDIVCQEVKTRRRYRRFRQLNFLSDSADLLERLDNIKENLKRIREELEVTRIRFSSSRNSDYDSVPSDYDTQTSSYEDESKIYDEQSSGYENESVINDADDTYDDTLVIDKVDDTTTSEESVHELYYEVAGGFENDDLRFKYRRVRPKVVSLDGLKMKIRFEAFNEDIDSLENHILTTTKSLHNLEKYENSFILATC